MKKLLTASVLAFGCWAGAAQAVTVVEYNGGSGTPAPGTVVFQTFDALAPGASIGANAFVTNMDTVGVAERPNFGSTGNFGVVTTGGSYSVNFGPSSLFSFVLGSLDTYNTLTLRFADGTSEIRSGGQITADNFIDSGNQTSPETNGVVTYRVTSGALITGATFSASGNSFEFDNLATAVPEPAAWGMMILGFGLVGGVLRRKPSVQFKLA
ncbi:PEPxxWA-CTERM sorting domain-containing protein [uncultured Sphingomonas sp.]|uniref:PEPxxWA-CTERM sorting domain-containing protein n=1 Tax=uncultured Sphingomonas sp. TaxID=158754 RepID=UPI0035C9E935